MNVLHIAAHMGDGAGKAIGGLAVLSQQRGDRHQILLLEQPRKHNHINQCKAAGIEFVPAREAPLAITEADVVVISWWGSKTMDIFLHELPPVPCRILLWAHKNGFYDPPLPQNIVSTCDHLLVTSPLSFENPAWREGTLVYGFGNFSAETVPLKSDYSLSSEAFRIGYVGMPSYKRFPADVCDYLTAVLAEVSTAQFLFVGEYSEEFHTDLERAGLSDRTVLLGWVESPISLLPTFDVFGYLLRPDTSATTENSVLEAMAAALPIVMSREPVGKYIIGDTAGILAQSPGEYAHAMRRLYQDHVLRQTLGRAAREKVLSDCSREGNYSRFQDACGRVMQRQKTAHCFSEIG